MTIAFTHYWPWNLNDFLRVACAVSTWVFASTKSNCQVKILYTFDEGPQCLARSSLLREVRIIYGEDQAPLGVIDLQTCLQCVILSSPEIISNLNLCDYAVYSIDYTEDCNPLVGHGMFSWLRLGTEKIPGQGAETAAKMVVGRVCSNILAFFSGGSKETLEINLRLKPITNCTQVQYLKSIQLYNSLASFLPANFDHPAWASFVSQNANLANLVQNMLRQEQQQDAGLKDRENGLKSSSPALPSNPSICDLPTSNSTVPKYYASSSPPTSIMSNIDSDALTGYSSPQPPYEVNMPTSNFAIPTAIPAAKRTWTEAPTSPISMSSPIRPNDREPMRPKAKRSLSTSIRPAESEFKTKARGSRFRMNDGTTKGSNSNSNRESSFYCYNCGAVSTTNWRRFSMESGDEEKEFMLCNPCGLWYSAKKTMRPPVPEIRRRGPNKPHETYAGPSIAEILNQNVRNSTSEGRYERSASTPGLTANTPSENLTLTVPAGGSIANRPPIERKSWTRKVVESMPNTTDKIEVTEGSPTSVGSRQEGNQDNANEKVQPQVKAAGRVAKEPKVRKRRAKKVESLVPLAIAPGPSGKTPLPLQKPATRNPSLPNSGPIESLAKQLEEYVENKENFPPGVKNTASIDTRSPIQISGFVPVNAPGQKSNHSQKSVQVTTSTEATSQDASKLTMDKRNDTTPSADPNKSAEGSATIISADANATNVSQAEPSISSLKDQTQTVVGAAIEEENPSSNISSGEPSSPTLTPEQINLLLMTPQKSRSNEPGQGSARGDDFGFFDVSNFSGSPSRWMAKILSSGGKSGMHMDFDGYDEAVKAIMMSPSKVRNDLFGSPGHDLDMDHHPSSNPATTVTVTGTTPTAPTFAKLSEPFQESPPKHGIGSGGAIKSKLSDSPAIVRKASNPAIRSTPATTLPSSPPQLYKGEGSIASNQAENWSDGQSAEEEEEEEEAMTVKVSPEPVKN